jgi:hypothetical protein
LELGELVKAQELFLRSYEAYVREPFRVRDNCPGIHNYGLLHRDY